MSNSTFRGVTLDCESKGWYPEPEVFWLDGEGYLLSAEPTETVRGPDDLYTVSSRVTVEKRRSNNFTCRVQQKNINQTRETHFHVPDDFFMTLSSSSSGSSASAIIGLVVGIIFILAAVFVVWKWRQNKIKTKRDRGANDETGKEENQSKSYTEVQSLTEGETEQSRIENKSANAEFRHMGGKKENQNCIQDTVSSERRKKLRAANGRRKCNV